MQHPATEPSAWTRRLREKTRSVAVRIEGLCKQYDSPAGVALHNVTMEITAGEVFALVGADGAGKSTVLKLICGLLTPTAGRVTINNLDVERERDEVQAAIGYLGSPFGMYSGALVWEYLDYFARAHGLPPDSASARVAALLDRFRLTGARDARVEGLSRATKLLLGVARALVHDPPLLLLDEPTLGLDARGRALLKRVLTDEHHHGKTIVLTSPTLTDLDVNCDTVRILEHGRLLPADRAEKILQEAASIGEIP